MNGCEKYQELISGLMDGELSDAEKSELEAHISSCPECEMLYRAFTSMSCAMSDGLEEPPAQLKANVMTAIGAKKGKITSINRWRSWLAVAACLAVIIFGVSRTNLADKLGTDAKGGIPVADTASEGAGAEAAGDSSAVTANASIDQKGRRADAISVTTPEGGFEIEDAQAQADIYKMLTPQKTQTATESAKNQLCDASADQYTVTYPDGGVISVSVQGDCISCRDNTTGDEFIPSCTSQEFLGFLSALK